MIFLPIINGLGDLRLNHIDTYGDLDNEHIRDDESKKTFTAPDGTVTVFFNGVESDVYSFKTTIQTPECYCICFSNEKNSIELFDKFNADLCLEIDILIFNKIFKEQLSKKMTCLIVADDVSYYDGTKPITWTLQTAPFFKHRRYRDEQEYRIVAIPVADHFYNRMDQDNIRGINLESSYRHFHLPSTAFRDSFISYTIRNKSQPFLFFTQTVS